MVALQVAEDFTLPIDTATRRIAMLAMPRAGKSNAAVVVAEEMHAAGIPWIAIDPKGDWWGIRASVDGKGAGLPIPVFGGLHGDIPLEPGSGKVIGELIAEQRLTCVLDVSEFESRQEMWGFLSDLATALLRHNREPLHIFADECHEYLPQKVSDGGNQPKCLGAWTRLVSKGGFRGLGITLISQRSAYVNKDVLYLIDGMLALRTFSPGDRSVVKGWLDIVGAARAKEIMETLPSLANGEAWVYAPEWIGTEPTRIRFRRRRTFDSGATPEVGKAAKAPAQLADIDIAALGERVAATIERAKADDPKVLRARIAELERAKPAAQDTRVLDALRAENLDLVSAVDTYRTILTGVRDRVAQMEVVRPLLEEMTYLLTGTIDAPGASPVSVAGLAPATSGRGPSAAVVEPRVPHSQGPSRAGDPPPRRLAPAAPVAPPQPSEGPQPKAGARRMLATLKDWHPSVLTRVQLGFLSDVSPKSGTFSDYLSALRSAGYIAEPARGEVGITAAGIALIGDTPPTVTTDEQVQEIFRAKLKAGARRMLSELITAYPTSMSRQELGLRADISAQSGTFSDYLSTMRGLGLLEEDSGLVAASRLLFMFSMWGRA